MKIPHQKHIEFYDWQIQVLEEEWERYANTSMKILIQAKRLFVGRIWGIQEQQGNVVLRFKAGFVPRMKQPYLLCIVASDAPSNSAEWDFTYLNFRESTHPRLSGLNTEIATINYLKSDDDNWSYILINGVDLAFLNLVKNTSLDRNQHPLIIVAENDPPIDYLKKLKEYVFLNPNDYIINLDLDVNELSWKPNQLDNKLSIAKEVVETIKSQNATIIQGPPGSGKSHLAAEICEQYIADNKSICITALTNKALMEIAEKPGLEISIERGAVFKTNLSSDETKRINKLQRADDFSPRQGEVLLSTYYALSKKQAEINSGNRRFDLLIIEEASQAYLATIAMFSSIADKVLIVGDHKQLTPVVKKEADAMKIHSHIDGIINGLKTFAFNNNPVSNRLVYTRRLTTSAAKLTGIYYDNTLKSISELEGITEFNSDYYNLFHNNGGISIAKLPLLIKGLTELDIVRLCCNVIFEIKQKNKDFEVALLTPYVEIEKSFYREYSRFSSDYSHVTINTIHKIQGLTCDITVLFLPLHNPSFDLNLNLFNVATSRAKRGTLIVTYKAINLMVGTSAETMKYIGNCLDITEQFMQLLQ